MAMPDVIDFEEALNRTDGEDRALLIGNGFSAEYFSYSNLLDKSGLVAGSPIRTLFDALRTVDFEAVVRALEGAVLVERAYGHAAHADEIEADAQKVREALVQAVNSTHPAHREDLGLKYASSSAFLSNFQTVFSLNYDLLLYWVNLEKSVLKDGFGLGKLMARSTGRSGRTALSHLQSARRAALVRGLHRRNPQGGPWRIRSYSDDHWRHRHRTTLPGLCNGRFKHAEDA
ncbi:hypothetical protein GCM10020258_40740 [Sphingomonas yabuuchiae]